MREKDLRGNSVQGCGSGSELGKSGGGVDYGLAGLKSALCGGQFGLSGGGRLSAYICLLLPFP